MPATGHAVQPICRVNAHTEDPAGHSSRAQLLRANQAVEQSPPPKYSNATPGSVHLMVCKHGAASAASNSAVGSTGYTLPDRLMLSSALNCSWRSRPVNELIPSDYGAFANRHCCGWIQACLPQQLEDRVPVQAHSTRVESLQGGASRPSRSASSAAAVTCGLSLMSTLRSCIRRQWE